MRNRTSLITEIIAEIQNNKIQELILVNVNRESIDDKGGSLIFRLKSLSDKAFINIIKSAPNLKSLTITSLNVKRLPPEIGKLEQLESLNLRGNEIETFPIEIGDLVNLRTLDIRDNRLVKIPESLGNLSKLEILRIGNTSITLQEKADFLPKEIGQLKRLRILEVQGHKLQNLPREIGQLSSLEYLDVSANRLATIPEELAELNELQTLDVSFNGLSYFPKETSRLSRLEILNIRSNKFSEVPKEINQLKALKELNISNNPIVTIPSTIGSIQSLRVLNAWYCKLSSLPSEICQLKKLEILDLSYNQLINLPIEIDQLSRLKKLDLQGNQLTIPLEIVFNVNNPKSILKYYVSLQRETRRNLNEVKLLIVGQGSVGKTSLVQQILYSTFNQDQTKTEGISINQWSVKSQSEIEYQKSEIKLNIWDFGGQEIMHATHQFFLTKRSLYLLVLDARLTQEENRVEYWLKILQSFGGESPVLIVGNKTDQHPLDIDRTGLGKKYSNIVGILETSAATGGGIEALKAEIAKQVDALPHVRDLLPETWFTVKSKLNRLKRDYITYREYIELCKEEGIDDSVSQKTLIGFLHDLGTVLNFEDVRLRDNNVLNPEWVTNGVYKILNSHWIFMRKGQLTFELLRQILDGERYPDDKLTFIIDMMKKFELCYGYEGEEKYLIPDLLPKDEPFTGEWGGALAFQIHYNVLPSSIISRFIVRMNAFIHKTIWRSGVVLKRGENTALVKADIEDRKIYIWVSGNESTRRDFLSAIRTEFEAIHKTIVKIEATEKVPLLNAPEATPVDLEFLQRLASEGRESLPVQAGNRIIDLIVKEVLSRIETDSRRNITINVGGDVGGNIIAGDDNEANANAPRRKAKRKP